VASKSSHLSWVDDIEGVSVHDGALVVVTADSTEHPFCTPIVPLLQRIERALGLDVVFVTLVTSGKLLVRQWRTLGQVANDGRDCDPAELDLARQVVSVRAAVPVQALNCLAQPVLTTDGREFGTVCCVRPSRADGGPAGLDETALKSVARLIALAMAKPEGDLQSVWQSSAAAPLGLA
jgi:hypothetical protein